MLASIRGSSKLLRSKKCAYNKSKPVKVSRSHYSTEKTPEYFEQHRKKLYDFMKSTSKVGGLTERTRSYENETPKDLESFPHLINPQAKQLNEKLEALIQKGANVEQVESFLKSIISSGIKPDYITRKIIANFTTKQAHEMDLSSFTISKFMDEPLPTKNETSSKTLFLQLASKDIKATPKEIATDLINLKIYVDLPLLIDQYHRFEARGKKDIILGIVEEFKNQSFINDVIYTAFLNSIVEKPN